MEVFSSWLGNHHYSDMVFGRGWDEISHTSGAQEKMLFRRIWIGKA